MTTQRIRMRRTWTNKEEAKLRAAYASGMSDRGIGIDLGRTVESILMKRRQLGLTRNSQRRNETVRFSVVLAKHEGDALLAEVKRLQTSVSAYARGAIKTKLAQMAGNLTR